MLPAHQLDFYKTDHKRQYPEGTNLVYSNFTPRSSRLAPVLREFYDEKVVVFGIQAWVISYLIREWQYGFFDLNKETACGMYKRRMDTALGPDAVSIAELEALHDLGFMPIEIKALPEGSRCNIKVALMTVVNTHPDFFWLTNYLETVASCDLWKPMTTATIAFEYRKILTHYAELTGSPLEFVDVQGHDFSFRGMSGRHDAAMSGMGHLLSFIGTDTIPAIDACEHYYGADATQEMIGCSVPATEHSVACLGIAEVEASLREKGEWNGYNVEDLLPST